MTVFKKKRKIIEDEILNDRGNHLYIEKSIKKAMTERYRHKEINTESTYIYEKMQKLLNKKVYMKTWNTANYIHEQGYINVFKLHKKLTNIIQKWHIPQKEESIYTSWEKEYMDALSRKVIG